MHAQRCSVSKLHLWLAFTKAVSRRGRKSTDNRQHGPAVPSLHYSEDKANSTAFLLFYAFLHSCMTSLFGLSSTFFIMTLTLELFFDTQCIFFWWINFFAKIKSLCDIIFYLSIYFQCRRCRFNYWVGKILWRRKWQPTPLSPPGESHGQGYMAGYSPWHYMAGYSPPGLQELDMT